jgi:WD40 repeat protein
MTGDVLAVDLRDRIVLIGPSGKIVWDKKVGFGSKAGAISADGSIIYVLTADGRVLRLTREAELEWEKWVDRDANALAIKAGGQCAIVASHKGRFHVISSGGDPPRIVHTTQPVAFARFSPRSGDLFLAAPMGWVGYYDKRFNPVSEMSLGIPIFEVKVCSKGRRIFLPSKDGGFNIVDMDTQDMTSVDPGFPVLRLAVDARGEKIAVGGLDGELALLSITGDKLWTADTKNSITLIEMTYDGDRFVTASDKGVITCYGVGGKPQAQADVTRKDTSEFEFLETGTKEEKKTGDSDFDFLEV